MERPSRGSGKWGGKGSDGSGIESGVACGVASGERSALKNKFGQLIDRPFEFRPFFLNLIHNQQTYLHVEMQFYISVMFLGLPDETYEEKPSFLDF